MPTTVDVPVLKISYWVEEGCGRDHLWHTMRYC